MTETKEEIYARNNKYRRKKYKTDEAFRNTIERKQESMPEYTRKKCHRIIKNGEDENS